VQELLAENQTKKDGEKPVDESCDQVVEVCQPLDSSTTCNATGKDDPMPLCHDVSTQCCINVRTLVNAETKTNESLTSTYCLSSDSQPPPANINTHLLDHNFFDNPEVEPAAEQAMEQQKGVLTETRYRPL
jgi:hypothetical protein